MKYLVSLLFLFTVLSCKKKVELDEHPPSLSFNVPPTAYSFRGGEVHFTLSAQAQAGLSKMQMWHSINGETQVRDTMFSLSGENFKRNWIYTVPEVDSIPSTIRLFFIATDAEGREASAMFTISVLNDPYPLGASRTGIVYNRHAPTRNAQWDLAGDAARALADSVNYDLINISPAASSAMTKGWRSPMTPSYAEFASAGTLNFDSASIEDVLNKWTAPSGVHVTSINNLAVGDVFVVWFRNGIFGILKVTEIQDAAASKDDQYIRFVYRKQE